MKIATRGFGKPWSPVLIIGFRFRAEIYLTDSIATFVVAYLYVRTYVQIDHLIFHFERFQIRGCLKIQYFNIPFRFIAQICIYNLKIAYLNSAKGDFFFLSQAKKKNGEEKNQEKKINKL